MKRRWLLWRWLLLPLLLGLGTTIAVAWGLAAWLPQSDWSPWHGVDASSSKQPYALFLREYRARGAIRRAWYQDRSAEDVYSIYSDTQIIDYTGERSAIYRPLAGIVEPAWGRMDIARASPTTLNSGGCDHATGWPVLAGWYGVLVDRSGARLSFAVDGGIPIHGFGSSPRRWEEMWRLRALPFHPIWAGIAGDTLFYAGLWLGLLRGIASVRRWWRRRLGRCTRCAYNLAGLPPTAVCPECGYSARQQ